MRIISSLMLLFLMAQTGIAVGQEASNRASDEAAIRDVVQAFIETRDSGDVDALTALLTPDADQQITSGRMRAGRKAVVEGSLTTTQSSGGTRTIDIESIRFLSDNVAIADGPYDIVGRSDGPDRHYMTTMIFRKEGDTWKIAAIRNMQPVQ